MPIRQRQLRDTEFAAEFKQTVLPSAIPAEVYVDWSSITAKSSEFATEAKLLESVSTDAAASFEADYKEALLEVGDPFKFLRLCFRLIGLGDSKDEFVVREGVWDLRAAGTKLENGDEETAADLASLFVELQSHDLLASSDDIQGTLAGIAIGLESHSRKNRQGKHYSKLVEAELTQICKSLSEQGYTITVDDEVTVDYSHRDGSKRVDFALYADGELRIVFELNCYSAQGSKPSEIKRSYETVARDMRAEGYEYVWVTDGYAWKAYLGNILTKAYRAHGDFYNLAMVKKELESDIRNYIEYGSTVDPEDRDVRAQRGLDEY